MHEVGTQYNTAVVCCKQRSVSVLCLILDLTDVLRYL